MNAEAPAVTSLRPSRLATRVAGAAVASAVYHRLSRYRGWSPARYEKWLTGTTIRLLD